MIARLDRLLGRVSMYLLVVGVLGTLSVVALVLALTGVLFLDPLAILVSAVVLSAASLLANQALGLLFRVRPSTASGVITAQLLLFVLEPTLDPAGLVGLALAAAVAAASKYLIAWRGRHLVNPAAAGALVAGLAGLAFSSWWIGTLPMLPFVAVGALLILWRTRRLGMGLGYLVVGTVISTTVFAVNGLAVPGALVTVLGSTPLVFVAGFMLSEPLTLPPRRWQRMAYAVIVAVLSTVPYAIGTLRTTPEFALVVGGALAFLVGQRRAVRLELVEKRQLTATAWEFRFRPAAPVRFAAGQYLELTLPHARPDRGGIRRVFSIASAPGEAELALGVRIRAQASSFKRALLALEPGGRLRATGVWGDFVLPRSASTRFAFVAAGIGITPFVSQLRALADAGRAADAELLYAVRAASELAYRDELAATGCRVSVLSPDDPGALPDGWTWLGSDALSAELVHEAIPDAAARTVYLSGAPSDVARLRRALRASGIRRIRTDVFLGY
ncbi:ferredoxin--NADP reductase [Protaetiibacter larvae]|nr:FAD-dependent oxidoreductase [Protaetiibacter larvae]